MVWVLIFRFLPVFFFLVVLWIILEWFKNKAPNKYLREKLLKNSGLYMVIAIMFSVAILIMFFAYEYISSNAGHGVYKHSEYSNGKLHKGNYQ